MKSSDDEQSISRSTSVWCALCNTNMLATQEVICAHFRSAHGRDPTDEEVKFALSNTVDKKFRGKKRRKKVRASYEDVQKGKERQDAMKYRVSGSYGTSKKR